MIEFLSAEHEVNFAKLMGKYPQVKSASDYRAACYILAFPDVFEHVGDLEGLQWPFSWCYDFETVEVSEDDDWDFSRGGKYYRRDCETDENEEWVTGRNFSGLSGGARRLVLAAMNLFNGKKGFDLEDGITSWDDRLFRVFIAACHIRRGGKIGS